MRVAAHVHSDWSYDGRHSLEAIGRMLGRRGYDAALMSEHDRTFDGDRWDRYRDACAEATDATGVLLIPGIEYSDDRNIVHLLVWGPDDMPFLGVEPGVGRVLSADQEHGAVRVLAHPSRREAWRHLDPSCIGRLDGIELWNRKTDGFAPSNDAARMIFAHRRPTWVGLDLHRRRQLFPLSMIAPGARTASDVLASARLGALLPRAFGAPAQTWNGSILGPIASGAESVRRRASDTRRRRAA